ncbi:polycystin-1-like protein 2 isoform X2 [Hydra vulgaris]|uniref:polycystin-1-like protein 2 isoform X2 n=1 Tax=Hydra vulgaris TaxID=6087 RepID=UPI0032E9D9E3
MPSFQRVNDLFLIQTPVSGLRFAENNPFPKNIAGYKLNSLLPLKAIIQNGSDVRYLFDIPKLNYSLNISSGDAVTFNMTSLGIFTVYLTAANYFSSVKTSIDIIVSSEINGLYLNVVKEQLQYSNYNTSMTLFNGTEVVLTIDFGDGTPPTNLTNCNGTGVDGYTFIINHTYSECDVYTVTIYASNVLVHLNEKIRYSYSNSTNVTVFCLMSPFVVKTTPSFSLVAQKQWIKLSLGKPFILSIYQDIGSYRNYSIVWGDGTYSYNNQSVMNLNDYSPVSFHMIHSYEKENTYNLIVTSSNALQTMSFSCYIEVIFCSVPEVRFSYGTILNPVTVFRSVSNDFTATVDSVRQYCENESFSFQWSLNSSISAISLIEGILSQQKVTYTILKNTLDFGTYYLTLRYFYGESYYDYTAYINVTFLQLSMSIQNGLLASYAYKIYNGSDSYFQNFTISAMSSYDPDNQESGILNINFTWSCKVASDFLVASYAMENFIKLGLNNFGNICFSQTWMDISSNSPEMNFSTKQFLEGINYHIKVCGTKVAGRDIFLNELTKYNCFVQEILIIAEVVPNISIICISNCDEKLNFKERVIYSFICADCVFQRLAAEWNITNSYGVVPSEILSENATTTGFLTPSLVINKDILHESTIYNFALLVGFASSTKRAKFNFTKATCAQPTSGFCYVNPMEGYALETKFSIFCNDWKDQDGLLSYMFFYDNGQSQRMNLTSTTTIDYPILNAASTDKSNFIDFMLGPGDENNGFKVRIIIKVSGKCKAYNESFYFIKVIPNQKPKIIADLLTNVNLPDIQSVTNLAQAISLSLNKNSVGFYNDYSNVKNQKKLLDLQETRSQVISLLNNLVIEDLNSFKSVSDALAVTSQHPQEVAPHAQNQAADIIVKLASLLTKENFKGLGADHYDIMTQSFVNSISNLFQAGLNNNKTGFVLSSNQTKADALSNLSEGNSNFVSKLLESLEKYFLIAQSYKVPGEKATVGETKQFVFVLKKDFSIYLSNTTIGSDGGFTLPNSSDMFNESVRTEQILVHNVRMKEIIYTWDTDRSQNILSESQSLSFSDVNGHPIEVSNSSQPIQIAIKNKAEKMLSKNISLIMPYDIYHVKLPLKSDCNMLLKFLFKNDPNNLTTLLVYIQYGKVATKSDYDIMLIISSKHGVVMTKNSNVNVVTKNITLTGNKSFSNIFSDKINSSLKRNQDAYVNNDSTLVLWNFHNATYAFLNSNELHLTFLYSGPMPKEKLDQNLYTFDEAESYGTFDYEMKSYCVDCNYWNESVNKWMSDGCQLEYYSTSFLVTKCKCSHLTAFGSFLVSANPLPKFSITKLKAGYILLVTVVLIIMLWILGLLLTRRIEKYDPTTVGVCPLLDNLPEDNYLYKIVVITGSQRNAGTKSNIFLTITGDVTDSGVRCLKVLEKDCFQRSSCSVLIMATQSTLGDLDFIRIWHDNSEGGWYIKNIVITDLQTEKKFLFIGQRWIATNSNQSLDCVIPVASIEESTNFHFVFKTKFYKKFLDEHLWFSIFASPSRSNFTRCQRLSVAVSLIMTTMVISTMFYKPLLLAYPDTEKKTVFLLLVSSLAKLPVELLLIKMFRSRLNSLKNVKSNSNRFIKISKIGKMKKNNKIYPMHNVSNGNFNEQKKMVKKKTYLFNWYLYIGWFISVGITFVCGFIVLLYGFEFGNAKSLTWLSTVAIDLIQSSKDFWPWMENFFLLQVYPDPWYNLSELNSNTKKKDFPGKLFLNDLNSKIVNGIRVRQIRVQPISCIKASLVAEYVKKDCFSQYASASEETKDFYLNWTLPKQSNLSKNSLKTPWSYQTWQELDGYPYVTDLNTYYGGGYVIEIFPKQNNKALLEQVKESRWIDRQTRALIIEFSLFNGNTNYFNVITMVLEFPMSGGVVSDSSIITFKLYSSTKESKTTMLVSLILFILIMLMITVRECRFLYRTGWVYFLEFWNLVEVAIIIFSYIAVGFFFYKDYLGKLLLERLSTKKPETFINFQLASYWNLTYVNIVALIVFFVTLKFIKLLRFNRRISMLSSTLKAAWYPLSMFGIIFFIILCSFIISANIMFGAFIDGYQTYFKTVSSIISLLLGKFNYSQFKNANPVLGPIFFLTISITFIWIVINMFISILVDAFQVVHESLEHEKNDYEMVDFILEHFKDWLGFKSLKNDDMTHQNDVIDTNLNSVLDTSASVTSEGKFKKNFFDLCKVKKERLHAVDTTTNDNPTMTLIERSFSKYDYLLNDNDVDANESLNKFIVCANLLLESSLAEENNNVSKKVECRTNNLKTDAEEKNHHVFLNMMIV